jgi:hypothetical protein
MVICGVVLAAETVVTAADLQVGQRYVFTGEVNRIQDSHLIPIIPTLYNHNIGEGITVEFNSIYENGDITKRLLITESFKFCFFPVDSRLGIPPQKVAFTAVVQYVDSNIVRLILDETSRCIILQGQKFPLTKVE